MAGLRSLFPRRCRVDEEWSVRDAWLLVGAKAVVVVSVRTRSRRVDWKDETIVILKEKLFNVGGKCKRGDSWTTNTNNMTTLVELEAGASYLLV